MGLTTPNIGIYIPAAGETNYEDSFAAGMVNIDQHDHSGGPNKGVRIGTSGIADFSITYNLLNANVVDTNTGLGVNPSLQNQIQIVGILGAINALASVGFLAKNGAVATARTFQNSSSITWTNPAGVAGNPTASLAANSVNANQAAFRAIAAAQPNVTGDNTDYKVQFSTTTYNQGSYFVTGATSEFTVPVTGRYLVTYNLLLDGLTSANRTRARIYIGGVATYVMDDFDSYQIATSAETMIKGSEVFQLTAAQVATLVLTVNNTGGTLIVGIVSGSFTITLLPA